MKPPFAVLMQSYPREERAPLYAKIGWSDVVDNPAFLDTCATRMSIALLGAGVPILDASMKLNAGPLKGRRIEPGQARLSRALKRIWGKPEVYRGESAARKGVGTRRGVVSFFRIKHFDIPTAGGHIDLVYPANGGFSKCARSCYFDAVEVWFWPLK